MSKLSQKKTVKETKTKVPEVPVEVPAPAPVQPQAQMPTPAPVKAPAPVSAPVPAPTPVQEEYVDLTPQEMSKLQNQLDVVEQKKAIQEVPQETRVSDEERGLQIQAEIERLQNTGVFRAEVLYQLLGINTNLEKMANALEGNK